MTDNPEIGRDRPPPIDLEALNQQSKILYVYRRDRVYVGQFEIRLYTPTNGFFLHAGTTYHVSLANPAHLYCTINHATCIPGSDLPEQTQPD